MNLFLNNNNKKNILVKIASGFLLLVLFILTLNFFGAGLKNFLNKISFPLQKAFWKTEIVAANVLSPLLNFKNLKTENENLKQENQKLLSEISLLKTQEENGNAVLEILSVIKPDDFKLALAHIIGFDSLNDFITIDKGTDDGILENMPVISRQKAVFGRVFLAYKNYSFVMLISNKNSVLNALVKNSQENGKASYGIIKGKGNLGIYFDLIQIESEIKEGDVLTTSALEGIFPKDFLIGKIKTINKNELKPFKTAEVEPFFNPKNTDTVFIITDYKQ